MGLNLSNRQIALELGLSGSDVQLMTDFQLPTSFVPGTAQVGGQVPPNGDGATSVGTSVARGGADGLRYECLD